MNGPFERLGGQAEDYGFMPGSSEAAAGALGQMRKVGEGAGVVVIQDVQSTDKEIADVQGDPEGSGVYWI